MSHPRGGRPCRKSEVSIPEGPQRCRTSHSFPSMFTNTAPNSLNQRPPRRRLPPRPLFSQPSNAFHQTWGLSTPFPQSDLGFFFFSDCYHTVISSIWCCKGEVSYQTWHTVCFMKTKTAEEYKCPLRRSREVQEDTPGSPEMINQQSNSALSPPPPPEPWKQYWTPSSSTWQVQKPF